jgi:hypothetical protein
MKSARIAFAAFIIGLVACSEQPAKQPDPLNGAWRLVAMHLIFEDGKRVEIPTHESLFIFADGYYSIG